MRREPAAALAAIALFLTALGAGLLAGCSSATTTWRAAPNPAAQPVSQLVVSGNACGPASLLNAFAHGDSNWQRAVAATAGQSDRQRLVDLIRRHGLKPSVSLRDNRRWQPRRGTNLEDLLAMANEMAAQQALPTLRSKIYPGEAATPAAALRACHADLRRSLARGLPPVVQLRSQVRSEVRSEARSEARSEVRRAAGAPPAWQTLGVHFVVVTGVPERLDPGATSFEIEFLDPWGARRGRARVSVPEDAQAAALGLSASIPQHPPQAAPAAGATPVRTLSAAIGRF